jgi:hypothetical protein
VGKKVDKVANKVDRATDADLVKAKEVNIRVTGLTTGFENVIIIYIQCQNFKLNM